MSNSLWPHGLKPSRLLSPWGFPGKNTGVGWHFILQGIFPTQGSNSGLLHCRQTLYRLSHQGRAMFFHNYLEKKKIKTSSSLVNTVSVSLRFVLGRKHFHLIVYGEKILANQLLIMISKSEWDLTQNWLNFYPDINNQCCIISVIWLF